MQLCFSDIIFLKDIGTHKVYIRTYKQYSEPQSRVYEKKQWKVDKTLRRRYTQLISTKKNEKNQFLWPRGCLQFDKPYFKVCPCTGTNY